MPEHGLRKLEAVLAADVAGYSRMMGEDEAGTLNDLRRLRGELFAPAVKRYRGTIIKSMGDGWLVEFPSVVDAVSCAIEIQEGLAGGNIKLRMGLHLGDITHEGEDIYGDGVNIAARLQEVAEPGSIVISDMIHRSIGGKLTAPFLALGALNLKNIKEPVSAYAWGAAPRTSENVALPLPDKPSIAVLPFTNMSGDPEQEYFSDGITEDIIAALSRIGWLFVIARNSSFLLKGKRVDVRRVSADLGVRYVLEGSVRKAANKIRIHAQLIDARSSAHLWAERYDRDFDEILAVQDEVVGSIVHAIGAPDGVLEKSERQRSLETRTKNPTAYDYYLRGRSQLDRQGVGNWEKAETLFKKAIETDAGFAQAYSALAWLYFLRFKMLRVSSFDEIHDQVRDLALHAIRLDQNDYRAHWVLGFLNTHMGKHAQGLACFDRALSINPNDANVLVWSSEVLIYWGRPEEALERCERALRLNPNCPDFYYWLRGFACFHLGRYEDALSDLERMIEPQYARRLLAATYAHLGRLEEAKAEAAQYMKIDPEFSISEWSKTEYYKVPEELRRFVDGLEKAGFPA
ncbi:tetratricopeptide repeat protein [Stappia sp. GBMRC 2046]|uniref:Tetratricopeptide repeat protein n=1 Tax=Stappia sediminis TaxID=2692190 RepID=A0A7X3S749_9HYPH|nr:tetratricopeptide repeat protein [Stappia sediminis]MXN64453.1 tetratricopeptide repeat protein [Stappia sediminis]